MNRYPLNSRVIGAGGQSPLSYATAIQVFVLSVVATAYSIRGMRVDRSLRLSDAVDTVITRLFAATQTLALDLSLTTKTYFQKYAQATQEFALTTLVIASQQIKQFVQLAQTLSLNLSGDFRHWIKTYAAAVQNFALGQTANYSRIVLLIKNQAATLGLTLRAIHRRSFKITQSVFAEGSLNVRKALLIGVNQSFELGVSLNLRFATLLKMTQSVALSGAVRIRTAINLVVDQLLALLVFEAARHRKFNPVELAGSLALFTDLTAFDVTTTPANAERTVILARGPRLVIVPGESYESGV